MGKIVENIFCVWDIFVIYENQTSENVDFGPLRISKKSVYKKNNLIKSDDSAILSTELRSFLLLRQNSVYHNFEAYSQRARKHKS